VIHHCLSILTIGQVTYYYSLKKKEVNLLLTTAVMHLFC